MSLFPILTLRSSCRWSTRLSSDRWYDAWRAHPFRSKGYNYSKKEIANSVSLSSNHLQGETDQFFHKASTHRKTVVAIVKDDLHIGGHGGFARSLLENTTFINNSGIVLVRRCIQDWWRFSSSWYAFEWTFLLTWRRDWRSSRPMLV